MFKKSILTLALGILAMTQVAKAQTNLQIFYDFAKDRGHFTTTLEGFYNDNWGNTFFFIDYDFNDKNAQGKQVGPNSSYMEIARCLNFWHSVPVLNAFSLQVEYNGGVLFGNSNFLFGIDYFLHSKDFRNTFNFKLLYKTFNGNASSSLPMQFTFVWGMQDLFGLKGLRFSGFADIWGENVINFMEGLDKQGKFVFLSEPQLWYNVGQHFGVNNLNIGGEVELSYNFAGYNGFHVRPCAGIKWVF